MESATIPDNRTAACGGQYAAIPASAIVMLVAGAVAAWLAAGSTGLLGHPLQHALTWLALAVAIVAAWPRGNGTFGTWAILAGAAALGLCFTASTLPAVNVLAVAIVLAAIAAANRGLTARAALVAALAATALGLVRFACDSIPTVWLAADAKGWLIGRLAGWMAGSRLEVGATYSGLDFLVLMTAVYAGWLICTAPPRRSRAIWAAVAILVGHLVYLMVLAHAEDLLAALPNTVLPPSNQEHRLGLWTWSNGLRTLVPWNLPLLAVLIHGTILAVMCRCAPWLPVIEIDPVKLRRQKEKEEKKEIPGSVLAMDLLFGFGPPLLAVAAVVLVALGLNHSDLKEKTVVAYEKGFLNWLKPEYDSPIDGFYGMLPTFVESLGGKFVKSQNLSEDELAKADVLVLLHPDEPWSEELLERVWKYVGRGGSLLLVADPVLYEADSLSSFNDVLRPTAMQVRCDTAVTRTGNWEQSYEVLGPSGHRRHRRPAEPLRPGVGLVDPHPLAGPAGAGGPLGLERSGQRHGKHGHRILQRRRTAGRPRIGRRATVRRGANLRARRHIAAAERNARQRLSLCRPPVGLPGQPPVESADPLAAIAGPVVVAGAGRRSWRCGRRHGS